MSATPPSKATLIFHFQVTADRSQAGFRSSLISHTVEETPPSLIVSTVVPESSIAVFFSGGTDVPGSPAALLLPMPDISAYDGGRFPERKKKKKHELK